MEAPVTSVATVEELVGALVAIDSVNPALVPGGAGEDAIARWIADWATRAGLEVHVEETEPGRPSVVAVARGSGGGRSLMLNAHVDTVGTSGMADALRPRVEDGRLYGRGAYDMKGALAACLLAARAARGRGLRGDIVVAAVADEEHASLGTRSVVRRWRTDAAVVTEPTGLRVCVAHKGFAWGQVVVRGRAAHGSRPDLGADAIVGMGGVLRGIEQLQERLAARSHPLLGAPSVHASLIEGGQELSSYPERCALWLERRTVPGETEDELRAELDALVEPVRRQGLEATALLDLVREPFEVDPDEPVVAAVRGCAERRLGTPPELVGEHPWMDAAITSAAGIPTVVFGPSGAGAHAEVEWVDLESVAACADVLLATAAEFCA